MLAHSIPMYLNPYFKTAPVKNRSNENWLDNKQVCELLKISSRTLQTYRDTGVLPYSQIGRKCYYKVTDIEQFVNQALTKK